MAKQRFAIGLDIGGTGMKAARVDVRSGELVTERVKRDTPEGARPDDVVEVARELIEQLADGDAELPVGVTFPAVVLDGRTMSAANVAPEWVGLDAEGLFERALKRDITFVNDADAAGYAEARFGAAAGRPGLTLMLTLGTGIGSALIYHGVLTPNTEFGHLKWTDGRSVEKYSANSAREREHLSYDEWAKRLQETLEYMEALLSPDTIVLGGGVSKKADEFMPKLRTRAELAPAKLRNNAGIIGAALYAHEHATGVLPGASASEDASGKRRKHGEGSAKRSK